MRKKYSNSEIEEIYDEHAKWYDLGMYFIEFILGNLRRELRVMTESFSTR